MTGRKKVQIISKRDVFKQFIFRIEEVKLRHEKYSGGMSDEMVRLNLDRGDAVAGVIHLRDTDTILMTEQFRYPTYENGPGWLLEIPAGMMRRREEPAAAMRRELLEETGYQVLAMHPISTFYLSPGGSSERIYLFYAGVTSGDKTEEGGGVIGEGEDIRTVFLPVADIAGMIENQEITDAKTLIGLQWLLMKKDRLNTL